MKRKADFVMQKVAGENILVPIGAQVINLNGLFTFNETAACVWERLSEDRTLDDLTNAIVENFNVTAEEARADVQIFVDKISEMGLLE